MRGDVGHIQEEDGSIPSSSRRRRRGEGETGWEGQAEVKSRDPNWRGDEKGEEEEEGEGEGGGRPEVKSRYPNWRGGEKAIKNINIH